MATLSKDMYSVLVRIPRYPENIAYDTLLQETGLEDEKLHNLLCEADYKYCEYINTTMPIKENTSSLTEKGQAALEAYEQEEKNQEIINKSLQVSIIAMRAAIGSAVAALFSLIIMIVQLLKA